MGNPREHFGYDGEKEGKEMAKKVRNGDMTPEELGEEYKEAQDEGQGEEFKKGYAENANG